jgi:Polyketide cyclase / dehydrase and lipid transport
MRTYYVGEVTMNGEQVWRGEYRIETSATPDIIWSIFRDVPGWKSWNAGIEHIDIDGPFSTGTWFTMKPPGEDPLRSRLVEVRENECFVDETRIGYLAITVAHRIQSLGAGRTRIAYAVEARGPEASEIGPAVASDFPEVLAALAKLAEARSS